jgi:hypothetical protein
VREHTRTPQPSKKRGRRRRDESIQISEFWPICLQAGVWRLKRAWIGSKLGELVPYFEYFDLVTQFGIWVSGGLDLRAVCQVGLLQFQHRVVLGDEQFG